MASWRDHGKLNPAESPSHHAPTPCRAPQRTAVAAANIPLPRYVCNMYRSLPSRTRLPALASATGIALCSLATASSAEAATDAQVHAAIVEFNQGAHYTIPVLSASQRKRLLAGEVVKVVDEAPDGSGSRRATGFLISDRSRDAMWVSCQDLHFVQSSSVHERQLTSPDPSKKRWYGLVDLPRPFTDRHYVVDVWNNHALAARTEGRAWEHPWELVPGEITSARALVAAGKVPETTLDMWETAIETPTNLGAWVAIALPDGSSIFAYHAATRVGGNIPEGMMLQYVKATLESTLRSIEERARTVIPSHYSAGHPPVVGGDGKGVAPFPR